MSTQEIASQNQNSLSAHGIRVQEKMTTPSRPGKKPRPVWIATGNIFGLETFFRDIGGKKFRGQWSFFENPESSILERLSSAGRESFAEQIESQCSRKEEKAARYDQYAENAEKRAEVAYNNASKIGSMIPLGQPILVGHHSEKRHRRDIERIDNNMRKSVEESKKSEYLSSKASTLRYHANRTENRRYVGNRVKEAKSEVNKLRKWVTETDPRLLHSQEKLAFWQNRLAEIDNSLAEKGELVPSAETISVGSLIYFIGSWYPVIRVNKKTVTISHWHGIETMTWKVDYTEIKKFKSKEPS
ncbi:MAG TPA: DUF3560 domain-containing protein [Bdellovibrio sp.]|uniref:DUF3560 domain-containing protein n=1 Tax=Bdellovibrio sp. TaxID=28201 RepID=UPI002EFD6336